MPYSKRDRYNFGCKKEEAKETKEKKEPPTELEYGTEMKWASPQVGKEDDA